jgi:adenylate cyclase
MNGLLQTVVDYIYTAIPNISNCGVLMLEAAPGDAGDGNDGNDHNGSGRFMLNYYQPLKEAPYFSETVARTALETGETFIWQRSVDRPTESLTINNIESAMCAVLKHQQEQYGVLFVNNTLTTDAFTENDVKLLGALAGQAGMFIRNQKLQETLRREEVIRANFMKHFSPKVAERLMNQETALRLGGELVNPVTVLFSDVRGFTLMSAGMEPGDVLKMLNTLFSELTPIIFRYNGTIDKYIGDAILAVFGSPERDDDQHFNAVQAALAMQAKVYELAETMQQAFNIASPPKIGIGIHTGELVHGFLGALERIEYTVIGDTVNMTSRYCAGADGGEVVISEAVYMRVKDHIHATQKLIQTKHEGDINGFLVQAMHAPGQVAIG